VVGGVNVNNLCQQGGLFALSVNRHSFFLTCCKKPNTLPWFFGIVYAHANQTKSNVIFDHIEVNGNLMDRILNIVSKLMLFWIYQVILKENDLDGYYG